MRQTAKNFAVSKMRGEVGRREPTAETRRVGHLAAEWRERRGLTLYEVTKYTGIVGPQLTRFENTGLGLSEPKRELLAVYYGAAHDAFFEPEEELDLEPDTPGALVYSDMRAKGLRARDFVKLTGIDETQLSRMFTGERRWGIDYCLKAGDALGTYPITYAIAQAIFDVKTALAKREQEAAAA